MLVLGSSWSVSDRFRNSIGCENATNGAKHADSPRKLSRAGSDVAIGRMRARRQRATVEKETPRQGTRPRAREKYGREREFRGQQAGRLWRRRKQAVCRRAIFALYLFDDALIVKTLVQGE